jgi:hypothetical protein
LYAHHLARKYSAVKAVPAAASGPVDTGAIEQVFTTDEGPVVITRRGSLVFVAESFPLPLARKLTMLILNGQGTGDVRTAENTLPPIGAGQPSAQSAAGPALSADLVRFFENCGVMKAAVDATLRFVH